MARQINYQPLAWFWDYFQRGLLHMDPPYQRRSVWNQDYKDFFIDTILNDFPAPAIFLFQEITPDGRTKYSVVDGKQRLSTVFDFVENRFPISDSATITKLRGKYFQDLDDDTKREIWKYQFAIEYIPSDDEKIINSIFDRINRNVSKLTAQELRHARFDGLFISTAENLAMIMHESLPNNFPSMTTQSRKQMKDVEFISQLLLLIEQGPKSYSQADLDVAFAERDLEWAEKDDIEKIFHRTLYFINRLAFSSSNSTLLVKSRLKNQTDFYSLFGAIADIIRNDLSIEINIEATSSNIFNFISQVEDSNARAYDNQLLEYYEAARSASNDAGPRKRRIEIIRSLVVII